MSDIKSADIIGVRDGVEAMLYDSSIDAIVAIDIKKHVIAWNTAAELHSGIPRALVLGKQLYVAVPWLAADSEATTAINLALTGMKSFVPASPDFAYRAHSESHYIPLKDDTGTIVGVMTIMHDVSHRLKAEQQLRHLNIELEKRLGDLQNTTSELANFTLITSNSIKEWATFVP